MLVVTRSMTRGRVSREMHGKGQGCVGLSRELALQDVDRAVEECGLGAGGEDLSAAAGAQIVDQVERAVASVESGGEAAAASETAEDVDEG
jgi:hypothetical protein